MWRPEPGRAVRAHDVAFVLLLTAWTTTLVVEVMTAPVAAAEGRFEAQTAALPPGDGGAIVRARCVVCHGSELIAQQRLDAGGWGRELDKMVGWGATVEPAEREVLVRYLARVFGAPVEGADTEEAAPLLRSRCSACHDSTLIAQQRLDVDGWSRELDKMTGWGATLSEAEKAELASLLGRRVRKP